MLTKKSAMKQLGLWILLLLILVAAIVYLFDPFYQYHGVLPGMERVLYDRDYQVAGSIRNLDYDSVILGSSVAENFNGDYVDEQFGCRTIKVVRSSGSVADLLYYLQMAHEERELKNVFWCMDNFSLTASDEVTLQQNKELRYLYTDTLLDDEEYLFNKDVLLMKIPMSLAYSYLGININGAAFDWSKDKEFSASKAMEAYSKQGEVKPVGAWEQDHAMLAKNLELVSREIQSHPDVNYTILFPPYSMLWWDCGYANGMGELYFDVLEQILPMLCQYKNVKVYYFQDDREIICNLDNYMDMIHYGPWINQYMLEQVVEGKKLVNAENVSNVLQSMRETYEYLTEEGIYEYYAR